MFSLLLVVVLSTTYIFVGGFSLGPRFNITNDSAQSISVTAAWRDQSRELGAVEPGATVSLTVRDEASMVVSVRRADGTEANSPPVDFGSGTITDFSVSDESITVQQDFGN